MDLVLLTERGPPDVGLVREAVVATFSTRGTHALPAALPPPPESWKVEFVGMATEANLSATDSLAAFRLLERFWLEHTLGAAAR